MRTIYVDKDIPRVLMVKALKPIWPRVVFSHVAPSHFEDMAEPDLPGPRWVRVRNRQCGICASDLSLLLIDADVHIAQAALPSSSRFFLGHEVLGFVDAVGPGVTRFKVGDRVIMDSRFQGPTCFSQEIDPPCPHCVEGNYTRCENSSRNVGPHGVGGGWGDGFTAHESELFLVPDDLSDDRAMMIEPLSTGVRAALRCLPAAGEQALVIGGGVVGLDVLQSLRALSPDCHITVFARYPHQAEMARRLGADVVVDGKDGYDVAVRVTGGNLYTGMFHNQMLLGGFHTVFDCVGNAKTLQDSLRWVKAGGRVVLVGVKLDCIKLDLTPVFFPGNRTGRSICSRDGDVAG